MSRSEYFFVNCSVFEDIAVYCETFNKFIPVAFILGFYVSLVVSRFWEQLNVLPWPHRLAVFTSSLIQGNDKQGRLLRRTIVRYANLAYVLTMRSVCFPVKKRFPTLHVVTDTGTAAALWMNRLMCVNWCDIWQLCRGQLRAAVRTITVFLTHQSWQRGGSMLSPVRNIVIIQCLLMWQEGQLACN